METENGMAVVPEVRYDLALARAPKQVLAEATDAAKALNSVVSQRKEAVKFNGKQYLTFDDFQTLGRFYGITAKITSTEYIEIADAKGFLARAEAINTQTGQVVSAAEAMCLNDEPNWAEKPLFQLRSMAQTRAGAKSLRNVLAWVAVLAGYEPSVAEEMTGDEHDSKPSIQPPQEKKSAPVACDGQDTFVPETVSKKPGSKGDKTWIKFGIKSPSGEWFGSFDENVGALAEDAAKAKTKITVYWKVNGQYKDVVRAVAA